MFVFLISTIPRSFYLSECELLTAVTKENQTTGNDHFGSVTLRKTPLERGTCHTHVMLDETVPTLPYLHIVR